MTYLFMMFGTLFSMCTFVFPFEGPQTYYIPVLSVFSISMILFFVLVKKDAGTVQKSKHISFVKLNKFFKPSFLCPTCEILKPQQSRHCYTCNRCVDRFDHHCQWVDNCIGHENHTLFFAYLIVTWAYLILVLITCLSNLSFSMHPKQFEMAFASKTGTFLSLLSHHTTIV